MMLHTYFYTVFFVFFSGKKLRKHHRAPRPPSPGYSTDSNYGTADIPKKPYPKSQRRKQMTEHSKHKKKSDNSSDESMKKGELGDHTNGMFRNWLTGLILTAKSFVC